MPPRLSSVDTAVSIMNIRILLTGMALLGPAISQAEEFADFELGEPFALEEDIPVVLTASRLKQPRAEVPASVTVIEAEQIRDWGVRTLPDLMRFVPGMFVGHVDDENNASVAYHSSNPSLMRRLQVLVDGRSVFRAGIASVAWDDIPVAMEDILRVEVTRGPNASTYGANSFLGVINIVTKHPGDTLGTRVRYRNGSQGIDDSFVSYSGQSGLNSYRLTFNLQADDGFDGADTDEGEDEFNDSKRHGYLAGYLSRPLGPSTVLNLQAGYKEGHSDIGSDDERFRTRPYRDNQAGYLWGKVNHEFSATHQSHLQIYWQTDKRTQDGYGCVPAITLDPDLYALYGLNPLLTNALVNQDDLTPYLSSLTAEEQALLVSIQQTLTVNGAAAVEEVCGQVDTNVTEQRADLEWQDTIVWSDSLRTVSGFSLRQDRVDSETYFGGVATNNTYRLFFNVEWRLLESLTTNLGAMYEDEDANNAEVSPRVAFNWMFMPQQSFRLVYAEAIRSPDLLEQEPDYSLTLTGLTDNYLNADSAKFYMHQSISHRGLDPERIASTELGYYGSFPDYRLALDVKVYQDRLTQLISSPINLATTTVRSDTRMDINGAEMQLQWRPGVRDSLWMTASYVDTDVTLGDTSDLSDSAIESLYEVETRLSAENSFVVSWSHHGNSWNTSVSHFWYDAYNNGKNAYRRLEINGRKQWLIHGKTVWLGAFWQHLIDDGRLNYSNQVYSEDNVYYLQGGLDF